MKPLTPKLVYLSNPEPGVVLLNVQFAHGEEPMRIKLSKEQLSNMVIDGTAFRLGIRMGESA